MQLSLLLIGMCIWREIHAHSLLDEKGKPYSALNSEKTDTLAAERDRKTLQTVEEETKKTISTKQIDTLHSIASAYRNSVNKTIQETLLTLKRQETEIENIRKNLESISIATNSFVQKETVKVPKDKFVAVFDGGSTGTRLNIYQFNESGLVLKSHLFRKTSVGIHLSKDPGKDIKDLLAAGKKHLTKMHHITGYDFPVVFNGTAGLRLIDERTRNSVLSTVKEAILSETGEKEDKIEVRVIDGKEEGFYAWAALVFTTQIKGRIGIIDLGGGSAQISFEVDKDMQGVQDGIVHGKNKDVLSRSFLGMGLVAGLDRVNKSDRNSVCKTDSENFDINKCKVHVKSTIGSMMQERTQGKEVAPGISQVNTIFVSSFIAETLNILKTPPNSQFKDIKDFVGTVCTNESIKAAAKRGHFAKEGSNPSVQKIPRLDCISVMYAVMFMENLGVGLFTPIKNSTDIRTDISWSLGRALSLIE